MDTLPILTKTPRSRRQKPFDAELATLARALGHPHRVAILRFLKERAACVCGEIVDRLPVAQSTVSQHLKKLKDAGWITGEIEGPRTCYCIHPDSFNKFRALVATLTHLWETPMNTPEDIRTVVRERYGKAAETAAAVAAAARAAAARRDADAISQQIGYTPRRTESYPCRRQPRPRLRQSLRRRPDSARRSRAGPRQRRGHRLLHRRRARWARARPSAST